MTAALFGGAGLLYLLSALLYYHGRFGAAGATGTLFAAAMSEVVLRGMNLAGAVVTLLLLVVGPIALLLVHIVDARRGYFLVPTIYSIPLAFFCAALLWILGGLALLF